MQTAAPIRLTYLVPTMASYVKFIRFMDQIQAQGELARDLREEAQVSLGSQQ